MMKKNFLFIILILSAVFILPSCGKNGGGKKNFKKEGFYITIMGFNNGIQYTYPLTYIKEDNESQLNKIYTWIDKMETDDGTALFYTIDEAMNSLQNAKFPSNLFNVSLVSFTDGLDNGSVAFNSDKYSSREEYQQYIKTRIRTEQFQGLPLNAYGIGVKSADVGNMEEAFNQTVKDISSDEENNAHILSQFNEVNSVFTQIASGISTYVTTVDASFNISYGGVDEICLTFDGLGYANSQCKITANLNSDKSLTNIQYVGLRSSVTSLTGTNVSGAIYSYTFPNIERADGLEFETNNVKLFRSSLGWGADSEFNPEANSTTVESRKTAVIALVLDMSSSLGNNVSEIKEAAKSFVRSLFNATSSGEPTAENTTITEWCKF